MECHIHCNHVHDEKIFIDHSSLFCFSNGQRSSSKLIFCPLDLLGWRFDRNPNWHVAFWCQGCSIFLGIFLELRNFFVGHLVVFSIQKLKKNNKILHNNTTPTTIFNSTGTQVSSIFPRTKMLHTKTCNLNRCFQQKLKNLPSLYHLKCHNIHHNQDNEN